MMNECGDINGFNGSDPIGLEVFQDFMQSFLEKSLENSEQNISESQIDKDSDSLL